MHGLRRRFKFSEIINGDTITSQWARIATVYSRDVDRRGYTSVAYGRKRDGIAVARTICQKPCTMASDYSKPTNVTLKPLLIFKGIRADTFIVLVLLLLLL